MADPKSRRSERRLRFVDGSALLENGHGDKRISSLDFTVPLIFLGAKKKKIITTRVT